MASKPSSVAVRLCDSTRLHLRHEEMLAAKELQLAIAQLFIERGWTALKPGGRFYLVTKQAEGIYPLIAKVFGEPEAMERRGYVVFQAQKGSTSRGA